MFYKSKPEMILFDVGGTLFDDGKCIVSDGVAHLRLAADNPQVTDDETLAAMWNEFMADVCCGNKSLSGASLEIPLSAPIKYVTMKTGLRFSISIAQQEEIFDRYNSTRKVIDGVVSLLETIHSKGISIGVISNNAMSGESLALAIDRWIPGNKSEIFLTSADIAYAKPDRRIFETALGYAQLDASDCWYCGDSPVPDVGGAINCGMSAVLLDTKSSIPCEIRDYCGQGEYLAVNHWNCLRDIIHDL